MDKVKKDKHLRENRNRKISEITTEKLEVDISEMDRGEDNRIFGASIDIESDDGRVILNVYGKNKNGAERLARTLLDKLEIKYRIKRK